ncbi:primosomal protein N' family DNA-binding protein, partial [Microbacterium arborescens]
MSDAPRRVARVLIDSPLPQLDRLFDYVVPDALRDAAVPGVRVKVPLRTVGRTVEGYLVELGDETDGDRPLSELEEVVSPVEVLPQRLYAHARRVADRAAGSASDVLRLVIPKRMVRAEKAWAAAGPPEAPAVSADALAWARETAAAYPELENAVAG